MKQYICQTDAFIFGHRVRAGEVFTLPDDVKPAPSMTLVSGQGGKASRVPKKKETPTTLKEIGEANLKAEAAAMLE